MRQSAKLPDETPVAYLMDMPNGGASDMTLKKNMLEILNVSGRIRALRPVTWHWKADRDSSDLQHGFVAQEVEKIFPELVDERQWDDGTKRKYVSTKALIPYLVQALKEQQSQIDDLRSRLEERDQKK